MSYQIQSVLLKRPYFSEQEAIQTIKNMGGKIRKIDITEHYYRFRQLEPHNLTKRGYSEVRTKEITPYISFIIYYRPEKLKAEP